MDENESSQSFFPPDLVSLCSYLDQWPPLIHSFSKTDGVSTESQRRRKKDRTDWEWLRLRCSVKCRTNKVTGLTVGFSLDDGQSISLFISIFYLTLQLSSDHIFLSLWFDWPLTRRPALMLPSKSAVHSRHPIGQLLVYVKELLDIAQILISSLI